MKTRDQIRREKYRDLAMQLYGEEGQQARGGKRRILALRYWLFTRWMNILWDIEMLIPERKV